MSGFNTIACAHCRKIIMVQHGARLTEPWFYSDALAFCSSICAVKGRARPVREPVDGLFDLERDVTPAFRVGASDALGGFDVLSQDPEYVKGHAAGMDMRGHAEQMLKRLRAI